MPKVHNLMEEIVEEAMPIVLKDINVCQCERCLKDIMAKALNELPVKYYVSEQGKVYKKMETLRLQMEIDVIAALAKAAVLILRSPRH